MTRTGILFVISGPSGVGKGTIKERLLQELGDLSESVSVTTRPPRPGETNGKEYIFVSKEQFASMIEANQFLEFACVYDNMYGTPLKYVAENLERGRDILLEIDIQGAMQVKEQMPEGVFIFIMPPSVEELANRLCHRGKDSKQSIETRLAKCEEEMAQVVHYDYAVTNDELDTAVAKVMSIVVAERCRVKKLCKR